MRIEHQLQIDSIKGNRIYYKEFGDLIFISDGKIGVYLTENELKIDKSKMIEMNFADENTFDPKSLFKTRNGAKETNIAIKLNNSKFAIKLKSKFNDEECFVNQSYLKMFPGFTELYIKSRLDPVLVYKLGKPYGIILPVRISIQED